MRTRFHEWKSLAERYGLEALMPKARRTPQLPNATPTHVVAELLTLAVVEPTIGCRQYADRLGDRGYAIAASTVQRHLVAHGLGKLAQRVGRSHHHDDHRVSTSLVAGVRFEPHDLRL